MCIDEDMPGLLLVWTVWRCWGCGGVRVKVSLKGFRDVTLEYLSYLKGSWDGFVFGWAIDYSTSQFTRDCSSVYVLPVRHQFSHMMDGTRSKEGTCLTRQTTKVCKCDLEVLVWVVGSGGSGMRQ